MQIRIQIQIEFELENAEVASGAAPLRGGGGLGVELYKH